MTLRRAIAVLILMIFAPAAVLAGLSLRDCVSADGHRHIKFVAADALDLDDHDHHHNHDDYDHNDANGQHALTIGHSHDCENDAALFPPASLTLRHSDTKKLVLSTAGSSGHKGIACTTTRLNVRVALSTSRLPAWAAAALLTTASDPQLAALKTVILLI